MMLKGPLEYELNKLINEVLREQLPNWDDDQPAPISKVSAPSSIDLGKVKLSKKKAIQKRLEYSKSQKQYKKLENIINDLFYTIREVEDQLGAVGTEDKYWYLGLLEKLSQTVEISKSNWARIRDQVQSELESGGDEADDLMNQLANEPEPSSGEETGALPASVMQRDLPSEPEKPKKTEPSYRDPLFTPKTRQELEQSLRRAIGLSAAPPSKVYGNLDQKWSNNIFKKAIEAGITSKEAIKRSIESVRNQRRISNQPTRPVDVGNQPTRPVNGGNQ